MYSNAEFDGDSDFAIKLDLGSRFDGDMSAQSQKSRGKDESSKYYDSKWS